MREPRELLQDMLDAIVRIQMQAARGREAFYGDELLQVFIIHYLQVLGEAARQLPRQLRDQHPEVPWSEILGMRNVLVHGYFRTDLEIVWGTAEADLPDLRDKLEAVLAGLQ